MDLSRLCKHWTADEDAELRTRLARHETPEAKRRDSTSSLIFKVSARRATVSKKLAEPSVEILPTSETS